MTTKSGKKKQNKPPSTPSAAEETLEALLKRLQIPPDWDYLVIGDGSGSTWQRECGWAAVTVERATRKRELWYGGANRGSVNVAEIMAIQWPLMGLMAREIDRVDKGARRRAVQVHILTDSQYVQKTGRSADKDQEKNALIWEGFNAFVRIGLVLHWHWVPRDSIGLHNYTDALSKLVRVLVKEYNPVEHLGFTAPINPWALEGQSE